MREFQIPDAECEIDNRIGVEIAKRDRARQGRTGHRRVDLGDLDRAPGPAPGAVESYGHVRRIAELRLGKKTEQLYEQADIWYSASGDDPIADSRR